MSPEQAKGRIQDLDGRSDVYALGLVLYEMLTLKPPFDPKADDLLVRVANADVSDVADRNPNRTVPPGLAGVVREALRPDPEDRYPDARALADDLRSWLDGTAESVRRHGEAERLAKEGRATAERFQSLEAETRAAESARDEAAAQGENWKPLAEQTAWLAARARVETLERDAAIAFADATHLLNAALVQEEQNKAARSALAGLWRGRLEDAERRADRADTAHALAMIRRYDDGPLAALIEGAGRLTLRSDPAGPSFSKRRFHAQSVCDATPTNWLNSVAGSSERRHVSSSIRRCWPVYSRHDRRPPLRVRATRRGAPVGSKAPFASPDGDTPPSSVGPRA